MFASRFGFLFSLKLDVINKEQSPKWEKFLAIKVALRIENINYCRNIIYCICYRPENCTCLAGWSGVDCSKAVCSRLELIDSNKRIVFTVCGGVEFV